EDCSLLLLNSEGEHREFLLIPPFDPAKERWYGKRIQTGEAKDISGIKNVLFNSALNARVDSALSGSFSDFGDIKTVYLDLEAELKIAEQTSTHDYRDNLTRIYQGIAVEDIYPIIVKLRLVKSKAEVDEFREAIEHTRMGILSVMAQARPGVKEYELADTFLHTINDESGYQGLSFNTIMASGIHATTLHYPKPLGVVGDDELVLMDLGARHGYYCADISRTIPASGEFNDMQRTIYKIVLDCNKAVANFARPGVTIAELNSLTKEFLASECLAKGIISRKEDISNYFFHSVSHHIGLDTHDPGDRTAPLEAGNIISDEPGLYIKELGIGVRIEDDLLITPTSCEVLSEGVIKEIEDIERFYKERN
ncbi:MAG: aminopeptidase P N-terminal domain-containing protein, partial [Bacilli bacterium]|nr:aminopeptidase P N-terminal domain-containing protein [Bacilli bacterium]